MIAPNILAQSLYIAFNPAGESVCELILAGVDASAYPCSDGYYKNTNKRCEKCDRGTFSHNDKSGAVSECTKCPVDTYNNLEGSDTCKSCNFLQYSEEASTSCDSCHKDSPNDRCYGFNGYHNVAETINGFPLDTNTGSFVVNMIGLKEYAADLVVKLSEDEMFVSSIVVITNKEAVPDLIISICERRVLTSGVYKEMVYMCTGQETAIGKITILNKNNKSFQLKKLFVFGGSFKEAYVAPGYYNDNTKFQKCVKGTFSKGGQVKTCTPCLENQYQNNEGQDRCKNCQVGEYSEPGAMTCSKCTTVDQSRVTCAYSKEKCHDKSEDNILYGSVPYVWPEAFPGDVAKLPCQYNLGNEATKKCIQTEGVVEYGATDFTHCDTRASREIDIIAKKDVDQDNQVAISGEIKTVSQVNSEYMNADDVKKTADILNKLTHNTVTLKEKTKSNILKTVDNINEMTGADEFVSNDVAERIRGSLDNMLNKIAGEDGSTRSEYITERTVAAAIQRPVENQDYTSLVISSGELGDLKNSKLGEIKEGDVTLFKAEVPQSNVAKDVTAVIYVSDKLFPAATTSQNVSNDFARMLKITKTKNEKVEKIKSLITDVSYVNTPSSSLQNPIKLEYVLTDESVAVHYKMKITTDVKCVFYKPSSKEWSTEGCRTTKVRANGQWNVKCKCDHMTSFAILMSFETDYDPLEELVSQILLGISLGCLLCTIIAYLPAKDMLKSRTVRINLLLATSLVFAIITFFFMEMVVSRSAGQQRDKPDLLCIIVAFLMNYFWLCQIAWMVCEAYVMYRALVSCVVNSHIHRYMLKFNLACWGIPLIFPIAGISWGSTDYVNPRTCFLQLPYGYLTFYGPVVLSILFNCFIFVRIGWKLSHNQSMGSKMKVPVSDIEKRKKQMKFAITIMSLLGISWVFGFLLIIEEINHPVLRWIFILTNCTQGILIFILYVLCNDNLRKVWLKIFGIINPDKPTHSSMPYIRSKGKTKETSIGVTGKTIDMKVDEIPLNSAAVRPTPPSSGQSRSALIHGHSDMFNNNYESIYDNALADVSVDPNWPKENGSSTKTFRNRHINDLSF